MEHPHPPIPPEIAFRTTCRKNGLEISDRQLESISAYAGMVKEWNQKINLVSRKDEENLWQNHILHSVSPLFKVNLPTGCRVLDLGTGGGLPGIPWSILNPESSFVLLDATQKKILAVQDMIDRLELSNAKSVWGRAEDVAKKSDLAAAFDVVIARAVAPVKDLVRWSGPFLRRRQEEGAMPLDQRRRIRSGTLIALKGGDLGGEISEVGGRTDIRHLEIIDLVFSGSEALPLVDKKIVIVEL